MKQDAESIVDIILTIVKTNMNTKLAEITAEKNDGITLSDIPDAAYYFNHIPKNNNRSSFVVYGITNTEILDNAGMGVLKRYSIDIEIALSGLTNKGIETLERSLMRYTRAIEEVLAENWSNKTLYGTLELTQIPSQTFALEVSGELLRVAGVRATVETN